MQFLVTMRDIELGALRPRHMTVAMIGQQVVPTLEALVKLSKEGTVVAGGVITGARASLFILETASHEEASRIIEALPIWDVSQIEITPIEPLEERLRQAHQALKALGASPNR